MGWYITILQEMRERLGLKGNELIVFAFINGYSQEGQGCYYGSLANLQRVCGLASRQTAIAILKSLVERGYIVKTEQIVNGVKTVSYSACPIIRQGVQKMDMGVQNLDKGCPEIGHHNKDNNKDININNSLYKERSSHFQKPSLSEVRAYCQERGNNVDPEQFINFYESNGWKVGKNQMKDWKACVRTWEKREQKEVAPRKRETKRESTFGHNLKVMDELYGTTLYSQTYGKNNNNPDEQ